MNELWLAFLLGSAAVSATLAAIYRRARGPLAAASVILIVIAGAGLAIDATRRVSTGPATSSAAATGPTQQNGPIARVFSDILQNPYIFEQYANPDANPVWIRIPPNYDYVWIVSWHTGVTFNGRLTTRKTTVVSAVDVRIDNPGFDNHARHFGLWAGAFNGWTPKEILESEVYGCDKGEIILLIDVAGVVSEYTGYCGNMT